MNKKVRIEIPWTKFRIEIPWTKFNEEEIQTIIAILFHSLGYSIHHLHKADRANEGGADLVVKKGKETIAIAVKIKPRHQDRYQLLELSRRAEKKKIYIYIQTPTKKFLESMELDGKNVEFWDITKLNNFFIEKNMYLTVNLIFENHRIHDKLELIKYLFSQLWFKSEKIKKKKFKKMTKKSFFLLWRLKDSSVTIHQTNNLLISSITDTPLNFHNRELNEQFVRTFLKYLDYLELKIASFEKYFIEFYKMNQELVDNSIIENLARSQWFMIASYKPRKNLNTLQEELKKAIKNEKIFKELTNNPIENLQDSDMEEYYKKLENSNDVWMSIKGQISDLLLIGQGIEEIIDDIVNEYFNDYAMLDTMKDFEEYGDMIDPE